MNPGSEYDRVVELPAVKTGIVVTTALSVVDVEIGSLQRDPVNSGVQTQTKDMLSPLEKEPFTATQVPPLVQLQFSMAVLFDTTEVVVVEITGVWQYWPVNPAEQVQVLAMLMFWDCDWHMPPLVQKQLSKRVVNIGIVVVVP